MTLLIADRKVPDAVDKISKKTVQLDASTVEIEERGKRNDLNQLEFYQKVIRTFLMIALLV